MKITRSDLELMAPVGSFETLAAAIQGGANAVYFGIEHLNMRSKSSNNFTTENLKEIVSVCNEHNVKTYLTLNTVLYDHDLNLMRQIIDYAKEYKVTAIIASDISVISYAIEQNVEVHASTQLNISNIEAVKFYSKFCDVIVLARELSLKQVKQITETIEKEQIKGPKGKLVEIEIFIHGALCMAISGKCYLSLHENNSSANRGACLQTCRKGYIVTEVETGNQLEIDNEYIMSPKDLCTLPFIDKVIDAGVKVLKIEGRARPPEYVKIVTQTYNEAINYYLDNFFTKEKIDLLMSKLETVFNRGFWDGYYLGRKLGEWNNEYGSKATKRKKYIAQATNYFAKIGVAEFLVQAGDLKLGDEVLIIGPTTGVLELTIDEIRKDLTATDLATKGDIISIPVPEKVRRADKLYVLENVFY